ncbi:MAG TPA: RNA 3'-terminal phosphate cyclase [Kofleriaceae bacterium]|nr:RNA 3'-terminal phosphate cyclase [Kofleriaceae bacterium]
MRLPVDIDGSRGEGGGQILRTSLSLSIITGRKLRMKRIRAGRKKPGLQRQHIACVEAAARLCNATTTPLEVGAQDLVFTPGPAEGWPTDLHVDIGTAGSTTLVVQTILVPALTATHPIRAVITGGTHNPLAPPFEFLDRVFLPALRAMGADAMLTLEKRGFMPNGGGRIVVETKPSKLGRIELVEGGRVIARKATAIVASLPSHVGDRELAVAQERLDHPQCELLEFPKDGPHNVFMVEVELSSGARELVTSHGRKGYPAEDVADDALDDLEDFLEAGVPVGEHLADQLLLPMAVAGGGRFRTMAPLSQHALTNIDTIREFLDVPIRVEPSGMIADVLVG